MRVFRPSARSACRVDGGASWNSVNFTIASTDISALVVDPVNFGTVYAVARHYVFQKSCSGVFFGGTDSGIFKTTNGGQNWVTVNSGIPTYTSALSTNAIIVHALAIDPINPTTLYSAALGTSAAGVFKSIDGGANWLAAGSGLTVDPSLPLTLVPSALAVDPSNPATIYAGTSGPGVFKTDNGASSWSDTDLLSII